MLTDLDFATEAYFQHCLVNCIMGVIEKQRELLLIVLSCLSYLGIYQMI